MRIARAFPRTGGGDPTHRSASRWARPQGPPEQTAGRPWGAKSGETAGCAHAARHVRLPEGQPHTRTELNMETRKSTLGIPRDTWPFTGTHRALNHPAPGEYRWSPDQRRAGRPGTGSPLRWAPSDGQSLGRVVRRHIDTGGSTASTPMVVRGQGCRSTATKSSYEACPCPTRPSGDGYLA